jgi:putative transposase
LADPLRENGPNDSIYSSDLTSAQWRLLKPLLPAPNRRGRPRTLLRQVINAIFYVLRSGCQWRLMPKDFGPWATIYGWFRRWKMSGVWVQIHDRLRAQLRAAVGKRCRPTAAILDSQTVRSADHPGIRGYDAAKKTKGRKRHLLVDTLGLILAIRVTPADVPERVGAQLLLTDALLWLSWLRRLWVDGGYSGEDFAQWVRLHRAKLHVEVVARLGEIRGFKVLPHRWVVERTFGWLMKQRRLVRDYEETISSAENWPYIAMIRIMLRRLA